MQQEERQKRDEVKQIEKQFVESTENMIRDVFYKIMFENYRSNIKNISQCFKDNKDNLKLAQECSSVQQKSYLKLEKRIEKYINNHQEGVMDCIGSCISNIYTPMSDCYQQCFQTFIEYSKQPYKKLLNQDIDQLNQQ